MMIWVLSNCAMVARARVFKVSPVASETRCRLIRRSFMATILGSFDGRMRRRGWPVESPITIRGTIMPRSREIRLNAFDMACVGHIQHGMWTHPRDQSSDYTSLDHWVA